MKDVVAVGATAVLPIDVWWELRPDAEFVLVHRAAQEDLEVRVEGPTEPELAARLEARLGLPVRVTPLPVGSLTRSSYKAARVIDE
jgi:hypothetical protein